MSKALSANGADGAPEQDAAGESRFLTAAELTRVLDGQLEGTTWETGLERLSLSAEAVERLLDDLTKKWALGRECVGSGWHIHFYDGDDESPQAVQVVLELRVDLMPPSADDAQEGSAE